MKHPRRPLRGELIAALNDAEWRLSTEVIGDTSIPDRVRDAVADITGPLLDLLRRDARDENGKRPRKSALILLDRRR